MSKTVANLLLSLHKTDEFEKLLQGFVKQKSPLNESLDVVLYDALLAGEMDLVNALVKHGVMPTKYELEKKLYRIVRNNFPDALKFALSYEINSYSSDTLLEAVRNHNIEMVKMILNAKNTIDVKQITKAKQDALYDALRKDKMDFVELLMQSGIPVFTDSILEKFLRKFKKFQLLVRYGNNIEQLQFNGYSLLKHMIDHDMVDYFAHLIENQLDPNYQFDGVSMLAYAIDNKKNTIATLLIAHGAKLDRMVTDKYDPQPVSLLYYAVDKNNLELTKALVKRGVNVDYQSSKGKTPIRIALATNKLDIAQVLLDAGADINIRDHDNMHGLLKATENDHDEAVIFAISHKANLDYQIEGGKTALMLAVQKKNTIIIKALLEAGANTAIQNTSGKTALMMAVTDVSLNIIALLLSYPVDLTIKDDIGRTVVDYAEKMHNMELINKFTDLMNKKVAKYVLTDKDGIHYPLIDKILVKTYPNTNRVLCYTIKAGTYTYRQYSPNTKFVGNKRLTKKFDADFHLEISGDTQFHIMDGDSILFDRVVTNTGILFNWSDLYIRG